jgi:hypothetical protein
MVVCMVSGWVTLHFIAPRLAVGQAAGWALFPPPQAALARAPSPCPSDPVSYYKCWGSPFLTNHLTSDMAVPLAE